MVSAAISLLIMLNPFGLFFYLMPVRDQMKAGAFNLLFIRSALISTVIAVLFYLFGEYTFIHLLKINFEAFRIFGGAVIFSLSFLYLIGGRRAMIAMKDDTGDLAAEIAMPFMIGLGSISLIVLTSHYIKGVAGFASVILALLAHFLIAAGFMAIHTKIKKGPVRKFFSQANSVLMRVNGFFIGAIGINMLITGIRNILKT